MRPYLFRLLQNLLLLHVVHMFFSVEYKIVCLPVRAALASHPEDYRWSSVRCWKGEMLEDEPLRMDIDRIKWRRS